MRLLYILLFSATLFAGEWTINDFTIRGKQFTQSATGILQGNLNRIPSYKAPKGDELLLRRRLDMNNYGLYIGKAEASAYTNLSRFTKPAGMSMDKLLKMKFFKDETPTGYNDVADIYFQGEYIYVKNLVRIFYNENGSWKSLEVAQGEKPGVLEISSTPSGATVTIDGVVKGKTPYTFVMDAPTVEVEVSKGGYYSQSFTADAKPGEVSRFAPTLNKEVALGAVSDPTKLVDLSLNTIEDAENRLAAIVKAQATAKKKESTALKSFEANYKKLKPQDMEFEFDDEFAKRKAVYDKEKAAAKAKYILDTVPFAKAKKEMQARIDTLDAKVYSLYLPLNTIKLGTYDKYKSEYPLSLSVKQGAFDFGFKGKVMISRDAARKFKFSSSDKGLRVEYGKRQVTVSVNGKKQKKYFKYGKLVLPFEGKEYELKGKVVLPTVVTNSKQMKAYQTYQVELARKERLGRESLAQLTKGMKKIPGGSFVMGAISGQVDEKPVHRIKISGFLMDSTEVTQAEYQRLMAVNPSNFKGNYNPVERCNWFDAVLYCNIRSKKAGLDTVYSYSSVTGIRGNNCELHDVRIRYNVKGFRLPTEAEWEYACRAGSTTKYFWGSIFDDGYAWCISNSGGTTQPVATKRSNRFGLYDMLGNVWEWCNDWYVNPYTNIVSVDPTGPKNGVVRVERGGCWDSKSSDMHSTNRNFFSPSNASYDIGFRCVLPILESN